VATGFTGRVAAVPARDAVCVDAGSAVAAGAAVGPPAGLISMEDGSVCTCVTAQPELSAIKTTAGSAKPMAAVKRNAGTPPPGEFDNSQC
jgi:hypothetical protein